LNSIINEPDPIGLVGPFDGKTSIDYVNRFTTAISDNKDPHFSILNNLGEVRENTARVDYMYGAANRVTALNEPFSSAKEHFISEFSLNGKRVIGSKNGDNAVILFHSFEEAHAFLGTTTYRAIESIDMELNSYLASLSEQRLAFELNDGAGLYQYIGSFNWNKE